MALWWKIAGALGRALQLAVFMLVFAILLDGLLGPQVNGDFAQWTQVARMLIGAAFGAFLYALNRKQDSERIEDDAAAVDQASHGLADGRESGAGSLSCSSCGSLHPRGAPRGSGEECSMHEPDANLQRGTSWPVLMLVAIVAGLLVTSFVLPPVDGGPAAPRTQCLNNLKNIGVALQNYHDHYGRFPPAYVADAAGRPMHSWRVLLLPYLDQSALYRAYRFDEPWNGPGNRNLLHIAMPVYCCPSDGDNEPIRTNYAVVVGPETMFPGARGLSLKDVRDPPESTVLVVELTNSDIHWMEPRDLNIADITRGLNPAAAAGVGAEHEGINVSLANGKGRMLPGDLDAAILRAMLTRDGGEDLEDLFEY